MKKKTEIATNTSSGVEKVERIEQEQKTERTRGGAKRVERNVVEKEVSAKGDSAMGDSTSDAKELADKNHGKVNAKKMNGQLSGEAKKESDAAKARVEAALKKKEAQEKRKAARLEKQKQRAELRAKKQAEKKALIEKRAAAKKALAEKRAQEKEARLQERAHTKANKNQAQSKKRAQKAKQKDSKRKNRGEHREGYGGWLAAVVTLGVVSLALTTAVTVGAVEMKKTKEGLLTAHKGTMYELTGIMEHVDDDLDRVRISNSTAQQSRILTDLLVQARLAEMDLERLPMAAEMDRGVTIFVNRTAAECERMLAKLRRGEKLNDADKEKLQQLYQKNHAVRRELDNFVQEMTDKDWTAFLKDGMGAIGDTFEKLEQMTLEENRMGLDKPMGTERSKTTGAGMERDKKMEEMPPMEKAKNGNENGDENRQQKGIDPARAETLCQNYFSDYSITEFQCVGESMLGPRKAYNVQGSDEKGTMLLAEISQTDGALLRFDYYEDCNVENFDIKNAERIAEQFLEKLGYDDLEIVRMRESGTTIDFTFVYEDDGVVYYPDEVRVKVCQTRGVVTGMDATKYLFHHKNREEAQVKITLAEAYERLYDELTVESSRLAVVKTARGEQTAYEFLCSYGEEKYFVYLSAENGEEISIVNARSIS